MKEKEIVVLDGVELLEKVKSQDEIIRRKANINLTSNFNIIK
ncbi:hypothetical protein [Romboutsia lituseburensis]|nr:hypothetical protein [Romboutsia lituseburensis]MCR8743988.1 hypothetical protein [Romboutsia lituseburensis]